MTTTAALLIWAVLLALFVVIEATTSRIVSLWFAAGAFAALVCAAFGMQEFWLQAVIAAVVSAAVYIAMRPLAKKFRQTAKDKLAADRTVGRHGVVTAQIGGEQENGMIRVGSKLWTARASESGAVIPADTRVTVEKIDGTTAVVRVSRKSAQPSAPTNEK